MLAELVKAGKLRAMRTSAPAPDAPGSETPESVGKYGGEWHSGTIERNGNDLRRDVGYEQLMRYSPDYKDRTAQMWPNR